jgi:hypothetical protein
MTAEVVPLYEANSRDVEAMARKLADDIARGAYGEVNSAVVVLETSDGPQVFGWGATDQVHSCGLMTIGCSWLANSR